MLASANVSLCNLYLPHDAYCHTTRFVSELYFKKEDLFLLTPSHFPKFLSFYWLKLQEEKKVGFSFFFSSFWNGDFLFQLISTDLHVKTAILVFFASTILQYNFPELWNFYEIGHLLLGLRSFN